VMSLSLLDQSHHQLPVRVHRGLLLFRERLQ
jgi:hypothetical protein